MLFFPKYSYKCNMIPHKISSTIYFDLFVWFLVWFGFSVLKLKMLIISKLSVLLGQIIKARLLPLSSSVLESENVGWISGSHLQAEQDSQMNTTGWESGSERKKVLKARIVLDHLQFLPSTFF